MSGTTFSVVATLVPMLIFTGSRLWLYFHRRSDLGELTLGERLKFFGSDFVSIA